MNENTESNLMNGVFGNNHRHPTKKSHIKRHESNIDRKNNHKNNQSKAVRAQKSTKSKGSIKHMIKKINPKKVDSGDPKYLWNMQADLHAIGKLTALEEIYGLKNRTQALNLLFDTCLNELVDKSGKKSYFKMHYSEFMGNNKAKTLKRYNKYHK